MARFHRQHKQGELKFVSRVTQLPRIMTYGDGVQRASDGARRAH